MILGMSMATFILVHVVISLIAIVAGLIVMFGMLGSKSQPGLTAIFLLFTILTSATGFVIPPLVTETLLPSHIIGALSLVLLAIACIALYAMKLAGSWRWIYVLTALICAVPQHVRAGDPELPQDPRVDGAGAGQPALRTGVRGRPGHRAGVFRPHDHRRLAALPPGVRLADHSRHSGARVGVPE